MKEQTSVVNKENHLIRRIKSKIWGLLKKRSINIIIFSKDRACQLELLLRSMRKHWPESFVHNIRVLYAYSNNDYKKGYEILSSEYNCVSFVKENNFKFDLLSLLEKKYFTVFFVDDIIFKENFSLSENELTQFEKRKDILCLSLRLHPNLTYCYAENIEMEPTNTTIWNWHEKTGDYGYPMSLDGHIFRTLQLKPLLEKIKFTNPNTLEAEMANNPLPEPKILCFTQSKIINNPCNIVQNTYNNRHGIIDSIFFNQRYLQGERISLDNITHLKNTACHQEIEVIFRHKNKPTT